MANPSRLCGYPALPSLLEIGLGERRFRPELASRVHPSPPRLRRKIYLRGLIFSAGVSRAAVKAAGRGRIAYIFTPVWSVPLNTERVRLATCRCMLVIQSPLSDCSDHSGLQENRFYQALRTGRRLRKIAGDVDHIDAVRPSRSEQARGGVKLGPVRAERNPREQV